MADGINYRIKGLANLLADLEAAKSDLIAEVKAEVEASGREMEATAKTMVPVDEGALKASINYEATNQGFGAQVSATEDYAAVQEFGTGALVDIPNYPGIEQEAAKFKGKGERQVNMAPQPFLIPAWVAQRPKFRENLKKILGKLTKV